MNLMSPVEAEIANLPSGHALTCKRADRYDHSAGLFYSPLEYATTPIGWTRRAAEAQPRDEWVQEAFESLVRVEFARIGGQRSGIPTLKVREAVSCDAADVFRSARDHLERLAYGPRLEAILGPIKRDPLESQLFQLLSDPLYLGRDLTRFFNPSSFTAFLAGNVDFRVGMRLLVPALPFRDQNPFRTADQASAVTLAEVLFLVRLHLIALGVFQVLPTGAQWIIVADGTAYAEALGVRAQDAADYVERLRSVRSALNLHRTVSVIDLRDVMRGCGQHLGMRQPISDVVTRSIRESLERLWESHSSDPQFESLVRGIRWNVNLRQYCSDEEGRSRVWDWLNQPDGSLGRNGSFRDLDEYVRSASLDYAAVNLAEKYLNVVNVRLPGCVRATTHPKSEQLPVPRLGSVAPWNGVAHIARDASIWEAEIDPLYRIVDRQITAHEDHDYPGGVVYYSYGKEV